MDPKLEKVVTDIRAILKENDMAGVLTVQHGERVFTFVALETSYSMAKVEKVDEGEQILIKGSTNGNGAKFSETLMMFSGLSNATHHISMELKHIANTLAAQIAGIVVKSMFKRQEKTEADGKANP
jgi:hypothetical protein